jgi:hypothetical protein
VQFLSSCIVIAAALLQIISWFKQLITYITSRPPSPMLGPTASDNSSDEANKSTTRHKPLGFRHRQTRRERARANELKKLIQIQQQYNQEMFHRLPQPQHPESEKVTLDESDQARLDTSNGGCSG